MKKNIRDMRSHRKNIFRFIKTISKVPELDYIWRLFTDNTTYIGETGKEQ